MTYSGRVMGGELDRERRKTSEGEIDYKKGGRETKQARWEGNSRDKKNGREGDGETARWREEGIEGEGRKEGER